MGGHLGGLVVVVGVLGGVLIVELVVFWFEGVPVPGCAAGGLDVAVLPPPPPRQPAVNPMNTTSRRIRTYFFMPFTRCPFVDTT